jgi:hypothetical protein
MARIALTAACPDGMGSPDWVQLRVRDLEKPTIVCPPALDVRAVRGTRFRNVSYDMPNAQDNVAIKDLLYSRANGSAFPVGVTSINAVAVDLDDNIAFCSFCEWWLLALVLAGLQLPRCLPLPAASR